jgi:TolB-like protein/class 3 adenylate cyclase/lipoprotein NlpI
MEPDTTFTRHVCAVLLADVIGFSKLMGEDDERTARAVDQLQSIAQGIVSDSNGRAEPVAGDALFATFDSVVAAVQAAITIQRRIASEAFEGQPLQIRIGVHLGDVLLRDGRAFGDAINIAARLEALARPGTICISEGVYRQVRNKFDEPFVDLGRQQLKNISDPVHAYLIVPKDAAPRPAPHRRALRWTSGAGALAVLIIAALFVTRRVVPVPSLLGRSEDRKSVAVLPFVNMSSDKENEYFSDGITEDLITALSKVSGLHVAARTSSFAFKGKNEPIENIGAQLHVGAVLEGSVSKAGNQVRITAQLINTADGYHLWSDSYDRELQDIFAVRSQVAQTVAKALQVTLGAGERQRLEQKPTEDLEAYQLYLKGRRAAETLNDWGTAMRYLQQAIARDPDYALAYVGLAGYYVWADDWAMSPDEALPRAREAAEKALQLDPSLAEAHVWLGVVRLWYNRDFEAARHEFQTALTLQPYLASAHEWYGAYAVGVGQIDEGLAESRRAVELDPLAPHTNTFLGFNFYFARRNEAAIKQLRTAVAIDPGYSWAHEWLGRAYGRAGRFSEAVTELRIAQEISASPEIESVLGRVYADGGDRLEATKVLNHLRERMRDEFISSAYVATILVGLGETDEAIVALAQAEEQHSYYVMWWKVDPDLDPLRSDPRFTALLKKVGLDK